MSNPAFCLRCGSGCCVHLQRPRSTVLTPREVSILRLLADPKTETMKELAFTLGLQHGTLKTYLSKIYTKIGWPGGTQRLLTLWAIAHREQLEILLPLPEQFRKV